MRAGLAVLALLLTALVGWGLSRSPANPGALLERAPAPVVAESATPVASTPLPKEAQVMDLAHAELMAVPEVAAPPRTAPAADLKRLGYEIDSRYYAMNLADLRRAARERDPQALVHLAERYLFQLDGRPGPDFDPQFPYRESAREALQQAFTLGNAHAAAMVSESLLQEQKVQEAAAWNLVARRAGDTLSADWFIRTEDYRRLSPEQREQAAQRAEQLWQSLHAGRPGAP